MDKLEPIRVVERDRAGRPRPTDMISFREMHPGDVLAQAGAWLTEHAERDVIYINIVRGEMSGEWMVTVAMRPPKMETARAAAV